MTPPPPHARPADDRPPGETATPDPQDARARQVELLPPGLRALEQLLDRRRDLISDVLADWPDADRALFHQLLERFNHDLTTSGETAATTR